jgi:hypothetical protein
LPFNPVEVVPMRNLFPILILFALTSPVANADPARLQAIRAEAENGDANAQNKLGVYYKLGLSTEPSDIDAVRWFRKSAEQGNGEAMFNLGEMYETGRGVQQDKSEALSWYRKSCESGCKCGCRSYRKLRKETDATQSP